METYLLKELLEFIIRQEKMDFKAIAAIAQIMQDESIPLLYRIECCEEGLRQNGLVSLEDQRRNLAKLIQTIPIEEFESKKFTQKRAFWEVLN